MTPRARTWLLVLLCVAAGAVVYLGFAAERAARLYADLTDPVRAFRGRLHRADPELGFAPAPGAVGAEAYRDAPDVPVRYDGDGFRAPLDAPDGPRERPLVLALGCSFTFGQGVAAESTFAHLVGAGLGGSTANAGVCGWGLAQMLVVARRTIERLRPDVVLVQLSPWLAQRAVATRGPTTRGAVSTPYFSGARDGLRLEPPRFATRLVALEQGRYREQGWSWTGLLGFLLRDGIPLVVHDDVQGAVERARVALGLVPPPTRDAGAVEEAAVAEIVALARRSGARAVVVALGAGSRSERVPPAVRKSGALVVDANAALRRRSPSPPTRRTRPPTGNAAARRPSGTRTPTSARTASWRTRSSPPCAPLPRVAARYLQGSGLPATATDAVARPEKGESPCPSCVRFGPHSWAARSPS